MSAIPDVIIPAAARPVTRLERSSGWRALDWRELLAYRDLLWFLVRRDVKSLYAQTVIGFGWAILRPLFGMLVFTVVFGSLARIPSDGVPYAVFSFTALVPWTYFSTAMTGATTSLISNAPMLSKVYFPRLIIPLTPVLAALVDFAVATVVLAGLLAAYRIKPTAAIAMFPVLVVLMCLAAFGIGTWLSALAVRYRDVKHGVQFLAQLLMYAAPVVWPVSLIAEKFGSNARAIRLIYGLYPMAGVIEGFRASILGTTPMPWDLIGVGAASSIVLAVTGALYFRRMERHFADIA
ncbi:MAG: type transporter [Gemmatimonadetes bacterium]|nr:type transporter [Gemmatimonadota bacterium]